MTSAAKRRVVLGAVASVAVYYGLWGGEYSAFDLRRLRKEREEKTVRLAEERAAVDSLRTLASRLEKDDATIERVARERFGMLRDGETLYRFYEAKPAPVTPAGATRTP